MKETSEKIVTQNSKLRTHLKLRTLTIFPALSELLLNMSSYFPSHKSTHQHQLHQDVSFHRQWITNKFPLLPSNLRPSFPRRGNWLRNVPVHRPAPVQWCSIMLQAAEKHILKTGTTWQWMSSNNLTWFYISTFDKKLSKTWNQ